MSRFLATLKNYIWMVRWHLALRRTRVATCKSLAGALGSSNPRLAEQFRLLAERVP